MALVLFAEGVGTGAPNRFPGTVVDRRAMSPAGPDPHTVPVSSKAGGIVFGRYFAGCGRVALLVALHDRAPSGRDLLIGAAVVHALPGAFAWGPVGASVFLSMRLVFALIVLLVTYDPDGAGSSPVTSPAAPTAG